MTNTIHTSATSLRQAWEGVKAASPGIRIREAALKLGVSEAELLATTVGDYTTRLEGDWTQLLKQLPSLGRVMSLTRNDGCVLEHKGTFQKIDIMGNAAHAMATVIGPIETRVFFAGWKFGFAVKQQTPNGLQQSIQIFDEAGTAVTKVFLQEAKGNRPGSNQEAFDAIVEAFKAKDQQPTITVTAVKELATRSIDEVDAGALLTDWENMKDTHDFFGMLRRHEVNRLDALYLAEGKFTYQVKKSSLRKVLEDAANQKLPIMIFAGNRGNLQIHQGKVQTIRMMENWLNVLDPDFNMHLREDLVNTTWVVKKPTTEGMVTSIEVFDAKKNLVVQFFGLRKPGIPELEGWRKLIEELSLQEA
ncbi:hemin-degrading factor [Fulvivirgaceae bacterium PWU4]|uniref:Hemin-degrading factor n=1 Tax=Chryseosolibacter histidini TaxID=2782349 RepID=A0AAP2DQM2_9BACT|nr:ChuX/HutX family heme-like substrate-binding protein [Chryseosolibacter histidini]MBT1700700.1 hemin-degrading factor [Chryseosolibacter histidini]